LASSNFRHTPIKADYQGDTEYAAVSKTTSITSTDVDAQPETITANEFSSIALIIIGIIIAIFVIGVIVIRKKS
jgi:hypothetical protein